jgi:hypothetical protein
MTAARSRSQRFGSCSGYSSSRACQRPGMPVEVAAAIAPLRVVTPPLVEQFAQHVLVSDLDGPTRAKPATRCLDQLDDGGLRS